MAASNPNGEQKYWFKGLPYEGLLKAGNEAGTQKYWFQGLPDQNLFPPSTFTVSVSDSVGITESVTAVKEVITFFKKATINAALVPATQTNFPSYVDLSRLGITTLAEASSVRVYADELKVTEFAREIVSLSEMHVKIPSLTSSITIYVEWDGDRADYAAGDTYGRNAVWSTSFVIASHLKEDPSGGSPQMLNSTGGTSGVSQGSMGSGDSVSGKIGNALDFDATDDRVAYGNSAYMNYAATATWAVAYWLKTATSTDVNTFENRSGGANGFLGGMVSSAGKLNFLNRTQSILRSYSFGNTVVNDNQWHRVWMVRDGSLNGTAAAQKIYIDGALETLASSTTDAAGGSDYNSGTGNFYIGGGPNGFAVLQLDEFYMWSGAIPSANWITTEYNNQNNESSFWGTWSNVAGDYEEDVFDAVTIAESVSVQLTHFVSVSDSITIAENTTQLKTSFASVSDSVAIAENTSQLKVVSDSIAITESTTQLKTMFVSVSDSVAITESTTQLKTMSVSVSDSIAIAESVSVLQVLTQSVFDAVAIAENVSLLRTVNLSTFDAVAIAESTTLQLNAFLPAIVDSIAIAENVSLLTIKFLSVSDSIAITEDVQSSTSSMNALSAFEALSILENISTEVSTSATATDNVGITESVTAQIVFTVSVFDSVAVAENVSVQKTITQSVSDSVSIAESISSSLDRYLSVSDAISISESVSLSLDFTREVNVFDSVSVSENVSLTKVLNASIADVVAVSEDVSVAVQLTASVFDSVAISESISATRGLSVMVFDAVSTNESISTLMFFTANVSDDISVQENVQNSVSSFISVQEIIGISEDVQKTKVMTSNVFDSVGITENVTTENYQFSPTPMKYRPRGYSPSQTMAGRSVQQRYSGSAGSPVNRSGGSIK